MGTAARGRTTEEAGQERLALFEQYQVKRERIFRRMLPAMTKVVSVILSLKPPHSSPEHTHL